MVTAGRSTPCTMEPYQKNLHPLDGEHQQAQAGKSRSLHVVCFLYFAWGYFLIENSIQVRERTVRDGLSVEITPPSDENPCILRTLARRDLLGKGFLLKSYLDPRYVF